MNSNYFHFMKSFLIITLSVLLYSCHKTNEPSINSRLLAFKSSYLAENDDDKYDSILKKNKLNNLEIKYLNDIIYVSYITDINACVDVKGDITFKNDSIILKTFSDSEEVCTSTSLERITYIINNHKKEKYNILFE